MTTSPTRQLTVGTITDAWTIYVNAVNQVRCVPDQFTPPTLDTDNTGTYSFKVVTDANKVCAVKVEFVTAMDLLKFSKFDITVSSSTGGAWGTETLYAASTGGTTKDAVDGLIQGDAAYVHQTNSDIKYYEIKVTYSYNLVDDNNPIPVVLKLTPLPQGSFT